MSKGLITFIAIVFVSSVVAFLIYFMKQSADIARYRSEKIIEDFKTVDKDLQDNKQKLDSLNKVFFDSLQKADK